MANGDTENGKLVVAFGDEDTSRHGVGVEGDVARDDPGAALEDGGAGRVIVDARVREAFEDLWAVDPLDELTTFTIGGSLEALADFQVGHGDWAGR